MIVSNFQWRFQEHPYIDYLLDLDSADLLTNFHYGEKGDDGDWVDEEPFNFPKRGVVIEDADFEEPEQEEDIVSDDPGDLHFDNFEDSEDSDIEIW